MEDVIRTAVEDALRELGLPEVDFAISHPENLSFGDYACNVAMVIAKEVGKKPREVAEQLLSELDGNIEYVEKIEVAGAGFLNFTLSRDFFTQEITRANTQGEGWGRNDSWEDKKVLVEYTDPNPFKEFHIGHVFTNTVGESLARLFMMAGARTKRVNYQGDVGLHVACAVAGLKQFGLIPVPHDGYTATELGQAYVYGASAYKEGQSEVVAEIKSINKAIYERNDETINAVYDAGRVASLAYFEDIYKILGTKFDAYFFESECAEKGKELVLAHPSIFTDSNGAKVFEGEQYGLHTRVFLNSEGLPTYEAKELALSKLKEEKMGVYDHSVISTSNEITEYFKVLKKAMSFVYPLLAEKTEHIGHGTVRLSTGKMSSRTGDIIRAVDFISEVTAAVQTKVKEGAHTKEISQELAQDIAIGAIKYATLRSNILQDATFDKEQALSFEGNSGPYLQYTYARICSAVEKALSLGITASITQAPEVPYVIERLLYRFPEVMLQALEDRQPHQVTTYITELAGAFNAFYNQEKIADEKDIFAPYKVALVQAVAQTLKNGLWVLGIKAPVQM